MATCSGIVLLWLATKYLSFVVKASWRAPVKMDHFIFAFFDLLNLSTCLLDICTGRSASHVHFNIRILSVNLCEKDLCKAEYYIVYVIVTVGLGDFVLLLAFCKPLWCHTAGADCACALRLRCRLAVMARLHGSVKRALPQREACCGEASRFSSECSKRFVFQRWGSNACSRSIVVQRSHSTAPSWKRNSIA